MKSLMFSKRSNRTLRYVLPICFTLINRSDSCTFQPKKELSEAAGRVGETSDWLLYRLRPDLNESQRTMRVNELVHEVAVATAALGQTAKELSKETPQQKEHNGKVLGGALKVRP